MVPGLLLIGDSQLKYVHEYSHLFPAFEVTAISRSGMRLEEVDNSMLLATTFFNDVVIHLGTNNLICGDTPEKACQHLRKLIDKVLLLNPGVRLFISSVLERSPSLFKPWSDHEVRRMKVMNQNIGRLNILLKELADRIGVTFIDNWIEFQAKCSNPHKEVLSRDGLHLSPRGVKILLGNVVASCLTMHVHVPLPRTNQPRVSECVVGMPSLSPSNFPPLPRTNNRRVSECVVGMPSLSPSPSNFPPLPRTNKRRVSECVVGMPSLSPSPSNFPPLPRTNQPRVSECVVGMPSLSPSPSNFPPLPRTNKRRVSECVVGMPSLSPSPSNFPPLPRTNQPRVSECVVGMPSLSPSNFPPLPRTNKRRVSECVVGMPSLSPSPSNFPPLPRTNKRRVSECVVGMPSLSPNFPPLSRTNKRRVSECVVSMPSYPIPLANRWEALKDLCDVAPITFPYVKCLSSKFKFVNGGSAKGAESVSIYPRHCEVCKKKYSCKSSFYKHKKYCINVLQIQTKTLITYPRVCEVCHVSYSSRFSYSKHQKLCKSDSKYICCPCPGCIVKFRTTSDVVKHLVDFHKQDLSVESHQFADMVEFKAWKKDLCQLNNISMVRQTGVHCGENVQLHYYICKFDNRHKNELIINKTSRKRKFGCMPNTDCMSRLIVRDSSSCINVKYFNTHNHELKFRNVKFYRWDESTKGKIDTMLEQDVPAHTIQESFQPKSLNIEIPVKEHFVSTTDINKMRYKLHQKKRLNKDDALAVHLLVHSLPRNDYSVLIYKPFGIPTEIGQTDLDYLPHSSQLFCLGLQHVQQMQEMMEGCTRILCIDATHGTNQYKYHLLNFVVPDEYGIGYPVAHFVTNFMDEGTLVCLLSSITDQCPNLVVNAVMTDGDEALGNAVRKVFGEEVRHLLCSWHVKRNWQKNLHRKVTGNDILLGKINEILETLMEERNEQTFNSMLEAFLSEYSVSASAFIKYFRDHYCNNVEKWAFSYRNFPHAKTETNMFVESFHNKLKTHYLNRKVNRRLDDLIAVLLRMHKTSHLALTYKRMTEKPPFGVSGSNSVRHTKGMQISDSDVVVNVDGISWKVSSQSNSKEVYTVICNSNTCNFSDSCFINCCEMSCSNLCCHMYSCSCPDCHSLCKHIHKVHSLRVRSVCMSPHPQQSENVIVATSFPINSKDGRKDYIHSISNLCDKLKIFSVNREVEELQGYINDTLKLLVKRCEGLITSKLSENKPEFTEPESFPPNSKITPQCRFYQTIKQRRPNTHRFRKPNAARKTEIKGSLLRRSNYHSFTLPLVETASITKTLFSIGTYTVSQLHLKSLDYFISEEELIRLQEVAEDFQRGWLYDTVIAAFLHKVVHDHNSIHLVDPALSHLVLTNPSEKLASWFRKVHSSSSKLLLPFNICNSHWVLSVVLIPEKEIHFYDPAACVITDVQANALKTLIIILNSMLENDALDWKICIPEHTLQEDGHNCGVFVAWYAEQIAKGLCTTSEFDPYEYRKYMYDVIKGVCITT